MKTSTITDGIETTLRSLAPIDLAGVPIYCAVTSEGVPAAMLPQCAFALSGAMLDIGLRDWLKSRGEWSGRGIAIIIGDNELRAAVSPRFHEQAILATAIHELGHSLDADAIDLAEPADAKLCREMLAVSTTMWDHVPSDVPAWFAHEAKWIRAVAHLSFRAKRQGLPIGLNCVADFERYELSNTDLYAAALQDEFERFENCSLIGLRQHQPPAAFVELWRSDVRRWYSSQPTDISLDLCLSNLNHFSKAPRHADSYARPQHG